MTAVAISSLPDEIFQCKAPTTMDCYLEMALPSTSPLASSSGWSLFSRGDDLSFGC